MDNRRQLVIALVASTVVLVLWLLISPRLFPPSPVSSRPTTAPTTAPTTEPSAVAEEARRPAPSGSQPALASSPSPSPSPSITSVPATLVAKGAAAPQIAELGSAASTSLFPMGIEFTSLGAAVADVDLRDFYKTVAGKEPYPLLSPVTDPVTGQEYFSLATDKIRIENYHEDVSLADVPWVIDRAACTNEKVLFRVTIDRQGKPLMEVTKTYTLPQVGPKPRKGHETLASLKSDLLLDYSIRNLTSEPLDVILVQRGAMGMHQENPRSDDREVVSAIEENGAFKVKKHTRKDVTPTTEQGRLVRKTVELGKDQDSSQVAWVAEANQYFACIVRPERGDGSPLGIASAEECSFTRSEDKSFGADMTFRLVTTPMRVEPHAAARIGFACYLGPKSKTAFEDIPEYSKYDYFEVMKVDFYCCAPSPIVRLMMWLLQTLYWPTRNYGVAIILLVLIVRTVLHPITKAGQVNMMKMQKAMSKLQPKVDEIKKKYANDRQQLNEKMMELYRDAGVNPATQLLTCLPTALQVPIWAGLWAALYSTVAMRNAPFDGYWIKDLAAPDALIPFTHEYTIPFISAITGPIHSFNLLPILLTISMYLQQKYMPKAGPSPNQTSDQMAQQMKIMNFMTIFFGLMFYNAPSGLNLYIMASNFAGLFEQWRIRKHIQKLEERDKNLPPGSEGGLRLKKPRFLQWLEKQAEEAKQVKTRKSKD
jgi:YidC/Oxa1 family membrane protein insertase